MQPDPTDQKMCRVCGASLQPENRFCPNCGTSTARASSPDIAPQPDREQPPAASVDDVAGRTPEPSYPLDPSILETREFQLRDEPAASTAPHEPAPQVTYQPPVASVPPETGNRTLWIILAIAAVIILVCCCILPLGVMFVANADSGLQEEIRSSLQRTLRF